MGATKLMTAAGGGITLDAASTATDKTITLPADNGTMALTSQLNGFRNRIINGDMRIDQRNAGASASSGTGAFTYTVDRWSCYATGAAVTVQRVAGSGSFQYAARVTGASSNTDANLVQRIESFNCYDLANGTVSLSAVLSGSASGTVTWALSYANATDTWAGSTAIASGSWSITTTPTQFTAQISVPLAATTGLQLVIGFGALGSGVTRTVTGVQLEKGTVATGFDYRPYGTELALCQRYFYVSGTLFHGANTASGVFAGNVPFPSPMRTAPSVSQSGTITIYGPNFADYNASSPAVSAYAPYNFGRVIFNSGSGGGAGVGTYCYGAGTLSFSSEL